MKYLVAVLLVVGFGLALSNAAWAEKPAITIKQLDDSLAGRKAVLVDVREERETGEGYIDGALLVPLSLLQEGKDADGFDKLLAQRLKKNQVIYCYCATGGRAATAAEMLKKFGYDAKPLKWGYRDLVKEGFVTAKPKPAN